MQGKRKDPIKCPECALRCLSTALGWGKALLANPSDKGLRDLFIGELVNSENQLGTLGHVSQRLVITSIRRGLHKGAPTPEHLEDIRKVWSHLADKGVDFNYGRVPRAEERDYRRDARDHLLSTINLFMTALNEERDLRADILGEWMCSELSFLLAGVEQPRKRLCELRRAWQREKMPIAQPYLIELKIASSLPDDAPPTTPSAPIEVYVPPKVKMKPIITQPIKPLTEPVVEVKPLVPNKPVEPLPVIILSTGYKKEDVELTRLLISTYMKDVLSIHMTGDFPVLAERYGKVVVCGAGLGLNRVWSSNRLEPLCEMVEGKPSWDMVMPQTCDTALLKEVWMGGQGNVLTRYHERVGTPPQLIPPDGWVTTVNRRICCSLARSFRSSVFLRWTEEGRKHLVEHLRKRMELKGLLDGVDTE
ncbi:MAG: hypothetical protein EOM68_24565 [Spirochaetia bacterium]|nr:hypothetical protein [Spirochaetia bacterium]